MLIKTYLGNLIKVIRKEPTETEPKWYRSMFLIDDKIGNLKRDLSLLILNKDYFQVFKTFNFIIKIKY